MKRRYFVLVLIVLVLIAACVQANNAASPQQADLLSGRVAMMPTPAPTMAAMGGGPADNFSADKSVVNNDQPPPPPGQQRVVLKNAVLTLVIDDVDAKMQAISTLADQFGGWIVNSYVTRANIGGKPQVQSASIMIRIPAARLDEALTQIKAGVGTVQNENVTGQDVTQDYVDLSSQLTNLQAAEKQLQSIMDDAHKTEDVLSVYSQLVDIRGQIETIQGRLRYYDESSAYASIQVTLLPSPVVQPVEIAGWRPLETARNAFQALVNLLQGAVDVVITVAVFGLPLLILIGLPLLIMRRRRRQRPEIVIPSL
jgi:Domain of unknown function (DUF4349)